MRTIKYYGIIDGIKEVFKIRRFHESIKFLNLSPKYFCSKKLKNIFLGTWWNITKQKNDLAKQRLDICNNCDLKLRITKNEYICSSCGCLLSSKTRVKDEHCDLNKW